MGAELVGLVSTKWAHLRSLSQYKILTRMALTALDKPGGPNKPAATFFGGWESLAMALGRDIPDPDDYSGEAVIRRKCVRDEVIRQTSALERLGAIKPLVDKPGRDQRQTWKLTL